MKKIPEIGQKLSTKQESKNNITGRYIANCVEINGQKCSTSQIITTTSYFLNAKQ